MTITVGVIGIVMICCFTCLAQKTYGRAYSHSAADRRRDDKAYTPQASPRGN